MPASQTPADALSLQRRFASDVVRLDNQHRVALPKSFLQPRGWLDAQHSLTLVAELGAPGIVRLYRPEAVEVAIRERHQYLLKNAGESETAMASLQAFEDRYRQAPFYRKRDYRVKLHEAVVVHLGLDLLKQEQRVFVRVSQELIEITSLEYRKQALAQDTEGWIQEI